MRSKLYGVGSFLPCILTLGGFLGLLAAYGVSGFSNDLPHEYIPIAVLCLIVELLGVVLCWVYIISMMIHAAKHLSGTDRVLWMLLLYLLNMLVFPVYWFRYVRIS